MHPAEAIAPMHFPTLMAECDPPTRLSEEVSDLLNRKAMTRELGTAPLSPVVAGFIDSEFELARVTFEAGRAHTPEDVAVRAEQFYRMVVERLERESHGAQDSRVGSPV
jgi:hypothetical protein